MNEKESPVSATREAMTWKERLAVTGLLLLACLALSAFQCQTRGCSSESLLRTSFAPDTLPLDTLQATTAGQKAEIWLEIGDSGVFTPTTSLLTGTVIQTDDGQTINYLDTLATRGYLAIRVPHVPSGPTSALEFGADGYARFNYYSPPSAPTVTTVNLNIVRRTSLEAAVEARYPTDSQSHWEVWWLPAGQEFPIPDDPFRLQFDYPYPALELHFYINFGSGTSAAACAGCPIDVLLYNGYTFIGPFHYALRYSDETLQNPLVAFGPHCGIFQDSLAPTIGQYISPTVPFTHVHCLENWDSTARTFTIQTSSSQGWNYTYYSRATSAGAPLIPRGNPPFDVTVGAFSSPFPGCLGILAVYTPTIAMTDTMRETFIISATSTANPAVRASSVSFALAPAYTLNELNWVPDHFIYLPLVLRSR